MNPTCPFCGAEQLQLQARIDLLTAANSDVERIAEERNAAEKEVKRLRAHIEKLEEVGDSVAYYSCTTEQLNWEEAKKGRP